MLVLSGHDMFTRREVDGRILRVRYRPKKPPLVAVDDGTREEVRAWLVRVGHSSGYLHPGNEVHATVTPWLGYVHRMEVTKSRVSGPTVHPQLVDAMAGIERTMDVLRFIPGFSKLATRMEATIANAGLEAATWQIGAMTPVTGLDTAALSGAAGIQLSDVTASENGALAVAATGGAGEGAVLSDGNVGRVTVARWADPEAFDRLAAVMPQFLRETVTGVGDEAVWLARGMLLARTADRAVMVNTALPVASHEAARDIATAIAKQLLLVR